MTTDRIAVSGIRARGFHGVLPAEKELGQDFVADVLMEVDLARAGTSDDLTHTVNYAEVAAAVVEVIQGPSCDLIERVAESIASRVLSIGAPLVEAVEVTLHKPHAPVGVPFADVAVIVRRRAQARAVVVAIGANLGDPVRTVRQAAGRLRALFGGSLRLSDLYETDPVGGPEQPAFINAVAIGRSRSAPAALLRRLHAIEADFGRERQVRWGPRTLDLDLIQVGRPGTDEQRAHDSDLVLPHPRAAERAFVLVPWAQVDPEALVRARDQVLPIAEALAGVDTRGVRRLGPMREGR